MREGGRGGGWKERGREGKKGEKGEKGRRREEAKAGKKEEKEGAMSVKSRSNHTKEGSHMYTLRMIFLFSWMGEGKKVALGSIGCTSNISGRGEGGREGETVLTSI